MLVARCDECGEACAAFLACIMNAVVSWQIGKGYSNLVLKSLQLDALFGLVFDWYGVLLWKDLKD